MNTPDIVFEARLSRGEAELRVGYTIRNRTDREIGIFNRVASPDPNATQRLSPDYAYVDFEDGILHLRKMLLPIPEGVEMAEHPLPFVTRLLPEGVLDEEFAVAVPVVVNDPVRRAVFGTAAQGRVVASRSAAARAMTLSIGVFECDEGIRLIPLSPEHPGVYRVWPPGPVLEHQRVLSRTLSLDPPVAVLDYGVDPK